MIPKFIHYCWFGNTPLPDEVKYYIDTWKKHCPDYKIIQWNEKNFDINCCTYVKEAYTKKKWAFVADYARLYALVNYGGIYLDTDVEVLKNLDSLLKYEAFCGFESDTKLCTAVLGCRPHFSIYDDLMKLYQNKYFILDNGMLNEEPNVIPFTQIYCKKGLILNGKEQAIFRLKVFPSDYFSPKSYVTGNINLTSNTLTIHHFSESWKTKSEKKIHNRETILIRKYGIKYGRIIAKVVNFPLRSINAVKKRGIKNEIKEFISRLN